MITLKEILLEPLLLIPAKNYHTREGPSIITLSCNAPISSYVYTFNQNRTQQRKCSTQLPVARRYIRLNRDPLCRAHSMVISNIKKLSHSGTEVNAVSSRLLVKNFLDPPPTAPSLRFLLHLLVHLPRLDFFRDLSEPSPGTSPKE